MARFRRLQVLNTMVEQGLVPIFYNQDINLAKEIVQACYTGGARCMELTNRGDNAVDVFKELELFCRDTLPGAILGAGSVVDAPTAALYIAAGANYIVSPVLDEETAVLCNKRKIPYMPGCGSVTEIHRAEALGVEICKIFPGKEVGGPGFIKALLGPCPWTSIMVTGGVEPTLESLTAWFGAGAVSVGMGSCLFTKEILKNRDFRQLSHTVKEALSMISQLKKAVH